MIGGDIFSGSGPLVNVPSPYVVWLNSENLFQTWEQGARLGGQIYNAATRAGMQPFQLPTGGSVSLDLGNLIGNLGEAYINARWGGQNVPQGTQNALNHMMNWTSKAENASLLGDIGLPLVDVVPEPPTGGGAGMVYDPVKGKWIRRRRRRRKRLATQSDIKELAALKGVLGQGEAFKTWIATRGC